MDFVDLEAAEESLDNQPLIFSEDEEMTNYEMDGFIDNSNQQRESVSLYRQVESPNQTRDPQNLNNCSKFLNQTRDPHVATYEDDEPFYGTHDTQPELYSSENRESIEFDNFVGYEKKLKKFKETLKNFDSSDNPFFDSIIYGLMFYLTEGKNIDKNKANEVIGNEFYLQLLEIKDDIKLDKTLFGYFNRFFMANEVHTKHSFFLKFFDRRDKFRFLIKKKVEGKHKVCAAKEGITYSFDNENITSFQDSYRYQGNLPFTVYFDFETTTGDLIFFNRIMYVVSYCQIYIFHPGLNLDKMVIFRSFQENAGEFTI